MFTVVSQMWYQRMSHMPIIAYRIIKQLNTNSEYEIIISASFMTKLSLFEIEYRVLNPYQYLDNNTAI